MYNKIIIFVFSTTLLILFYGCSNSINEAETSFTNEIKVKNIKDTVVFDSLVQEYKYIQLETSVKSLLGEIKKIIFYKNKIYILSQGLFCFDTNGKFIFSINNRGKGPSEFIKINDMSIDNDNIYLYDNSLSKILLFHFETGKFIRDVNLAYSVKQLLVVDRTLFMNRGLFPNRFLSDNNLIMVSKIDKQDKIKSYLSYKEYQMNTEQQLYGYNKQIYYIDQIFNKVYKVYPGRLENYLYYDFDKQNPTIVEAYHKSFDLFSNKNKAYNLQDVYETQNFIFSNLSIGKKHLWILYDKQSKVQSSYENLKCKLHQLQPGSNAIYGDYFCRLVSNTEVYFSKLRMEEEKLSLATSDKEYKNYDIIRKAKLGDNPLIALYKFKKLN